MTKIKICGIKDQTALHACIQNNADFIGFVFYPPSPRAITMNAATPLIKATPPHIKSVGLFVNPDIEYLKSVSKQCNLDLIQLHGNESVEQVQHIKSELNLPIIKAISIATSDDLKLIKLYEPHVDWILCDAKSNASLPGGNGVTFDWTILKHHTFNKPWMLSGGLNATNVKQALNQLNPDAIDVSSGVEEQIGIKNPEKIKDFINQIRYK